MEKITGILHNSVVTTQSFSNMRIALTMGIAHSDSQELIKVYFAKNTFRN